MDKRLVAAIGLACLFGLMCALVGCEMLRQFAQGAISGAGDSIQNDPTPFMDGQADLIKYGIGALFGGLGGSIPAYRSGLKRNKQGVTDQIPS